MYRGGTGKENNIMKEIVNELFIRLTETTDRWDFIELMEEK